ncbi:hypothetical protein GCM10027061_24830 [Nesterenkonia suensis]
MPDELRLPERLTGEEFFEFTRSLRRSSDRGIFREALEGLRLDLVADVVIGQYSHGMKKKLQLAVTLSHRPDVLILEEPFSGLDPRTHLVLQALLQEYIRGGGAVLISTHDLRFAEHAFDEVHLLHRGALIASGTPGRVMEQTETGSLLDAYVELTAPDDDPVLSDQEFMEDYFGQA